jgi:hypothetical protein
MGTPNLRERTLEAARATPAPTRQTWLLRQAGWLATATLLFGGLAAVHGSAPLAARPRVYVGTLCLGAVAVLPVLAGWAFAFLRSPLGPTPLTRTLIGRFTVPALALGALLANALAPETLQAPASDFWLHLWCPLALLSSGALVGWLALRANRGAEPLTPRVSARTLGGVIGAAAALAVSVQCEFADPVHALAGHVVPVALLMAGMARWGAKVLRSPKRDASAST